MPVACARVSQLHSCHVSWFELRKLCASQTPSNYGPPEGWKGSTPTRGTLSFDFVSMQPLEESAIAISEWLFVL